MKGPFLLFLLLELANLADAQSSDSGRITFLDLDASVSPDLLDRLDNYQPMTDRERVLLKNNLDSLTAWISVDLAIALYEAFERKGLPFEPVDALRDYLPYDHMGLPSVLIAKSAIKKLDKQGYRSDLYFSFQLNVGVRGILQGIGTRIRPKMECTLKIFSPERELIRTLQVDWAAEEHIDSAEFPRRRFDKLSFDHLLQLYDRLRPALVSLAVEAASRY